MKVVLVDDQKLIRDGIKSLLSFQPGVEVVAEYSNGQALIEQLDTLQADIILLDLNMPVMNGIETLEALAKQKTTLPVLMLTTFDDPKLVLDSLDKGARGFVLKDIALETLVAAMEVIIQGETYFQPAITNSLLQQVSNNRQGLERQSHCEALSNREVEVLRLLANGYSNKEIAAALHKSEGTIKNHVSNLLAKLGVRDRTKAVLLAIEQRLI
ncbi:MULTISPECIES: response regulator transcription factor [unclassified Pseudoalteromonas]|uniref:response regulator transcription factor n=1 Tax=unclassified Pseudoalteromonas TaxID=194690 RepID=UPI00301571A8